MAPTAVVRILLAAMLGIGLVGGVDAARAGSWDLFVILVALCLGLVVLLVASAAGRPLVPVRADLVRWIGRRASLSGERPGAVADRAIAAYRAGLTSPSGEGHERTDR